MPFLDGRDNKDIIDIYQKSNFQTFNSTVYGKSRIVQKNKYMSNDSVRNGLACIGEKSINVDTIYRENRDSRNNSRNNSRNSHVRRNVTGNIGSLKDRSIEETILTNKGG